MEFVSEFIEIALDDLHADADRRHKDGWRYVQILAVNRQDAVDMIYSYMKDGALENVAIRNVPRDAVVPSISDIFFEAFVCENEIHDLFGVHIENIAIDFLGNFYKVAESYPMTIVTPEQLAAKQKAAKIATAKALKEAKETSGEESSADGAPSSAATSKTSDEDLEAKLAAMPPEKAAKVRAAMEAKAKREESKKGE